MCVNKLKETLLQADVDIPLFHDRGDIRSDAFQGGSVVIQLMHIMHPVRVSCTASKARPTTSPLMRDGSLRNAHARRNATPADPHAWSLFKLVSSSASFRLDFRLCSGRRVTGFERVIFRETAARERSAYIRTCVSQNTIHLNSTEDDIAQKKYNFKKISFSLIPFLIFLFIFQRSSFVKNLIKQFNKIVIYSL